MKELRLIKRDLVIGCISKWYRYLLVIFFSCFMCHNLYNNTVIYYINRGIISTKGGLLDYLLCINPGMNIYSISNEMTFTVPVYWLVFQMSIHYITGYYPENDYRLHGKNVMLRTKSGGSWWISKCIWCTLSVLFYYLAMTVAVVLYTFFKTGTIAYSFSERVETSVYGTSLKYIFNNDVVLITCIVPFVVTLALCMLQMFFSFIVSPEISFAIISGYYVLSAYYHSGFMLGGYTMWRRSSYIIEGGLNPQTGIAVGLFLILACVVIGKVYFEEKDII